MGWEEIENKLPMGDTLESISAGHRIDVAFINSFMQAYLERVGYVLNSIQAAAYEGLLLVDINGIPKNGISDRELIDRLTRFNSLVNDIYNSGAWITEDNWNEIISLPEDFLLDTTNVNDPVIDLDTWNSNDVEDLIGVNAYAIIFGGSFSVRKCLEADYWVGLYKLLKYVIKYRSIGVSTSAAPDPNTIIIPRFYFNGAIKGSDEDEGIYYSEIPSLPTETTDNSIEMLESMIANIESSTPSVTGITSGSGNPLYECQWSWEDRNAAFAGNNVENYTTANASVSINRYVEPPFMRTPTAMRFELVASSEGKLTYYESSNTYAESNPAYSEFYRTRISTKEIIPATRDTSSGTVYTPDFDTYWNRRGHHYSGVTTFNNGINSMDLSFIEDIIQRDKQYTAAPKFTYQGGFHTQFSESIEGRMAESEIKLRRLVGELPQDDFEFPA